MAGSGAGLGGTTGSVVTLLLGTRCAPVSEGNHCERAWGAVGSSVNWQPQPGSKPLSSACRQQPYLTSCPQL